MPMKPKTSKRPTYSKPAVNLKDTKPKRNPVAGGSNQGWGRWEVNPAEVLSGP